MKNSSSEDHKSIDAILEKWESTLNRLSEEVDATLTGKVSGEEKFLISRGLKLRNKVKTSGGSEDGSQGEKIKGFLYTVVDVRPNGVILQTPEGKEFPVGREELESNYEID